MSNVWEMCASWFCETIEKQRLIKMYQRKLLSKLWKLKKLRDTKE